MASVRKRPWTHNGVKKHAWVVDYTDGEGTRRLKTFDLKRDADAYRLKAQTEIEAGVHTPDRESLRFHLLAEQYIASMEARANEGRGLSHGYVTRLRASIRRHIVPGFKQRLISEITFAQVEAWLIALGEKGTLARTTVREAGSFLGAIFDYANKRGLTQKNPVWLVLKERRGAPADPIRTFQTDEVMRLLNTLQQRIPRTKHFAHRRLSLFVHIGAFCGLRFGEISALTLGAFDLDARVIRVRHSITAQGLLKGPKTRAGLRDVPMPPHVADMVREWLAKDYHPNPQQLLFMKESGVAFSNANFHVEWHRLLDRAGLSKSDTLGHFHFHALRHFAASYMIEHGLPLTDVAQVLGHKKFDMTLQVYAHPIVAGHRRIETVDRMAAGLLPAPRNIAA